MSCKSDIMYVTNATTRHKIPARDRPVSEERQKAESPGSRGLRVMPLRESRPRPLYHYLGRFFAFFLAFWTCGCGGVASILRKTSSALGGGAGLRSCFMVIGA